MIGKGVSVLIGCLVVAVATQAQSSASMLPTGTSLRVKLETSVNTKTAEGETVEAKLAQSASLDGQIVLPVGTQLSGRITSVQLRYGELRLTFDKVSLPSGWTFTAQSSNSPNALAQPLLLTSFRRSRLWSKAKPIALVLAFPVVGASIGAAVGGGAGARQGAGTGGVIGLVAALFVDRAGPGPWENFELKAGQRASLRLETPFPVALKD